MRLSGFMIEQHTQIWMYAALYFPCIHEHFFDYNNGTFWLTGVVCFAPLAQFSIVNRQRFK